MKRSGKFYSKNEKERGQLYRKVFTKEQKR